MGLTCSLINSVVTQNCNLRRVANDVAFLPPCPCRYMLGVSGGIRFGKINFRKRLITIPKNVKIEVLHILEDRTVCLFHITTEKPKAVIIYSHGNATDCGGMLPRCIQMSQKLKVDVIIYDYEGYGYSIGEPSDVSICTDIEIVYAYTRRFFSSKSIFLYGESIGSVPTLHLSEVLSKRIKPYSSILYSEVIPSIELSTLFPDDVLSPDDHDDIQLYRDQSKNIQLIMHDLIENLRSSSTEGLLDVDYSPLLSLSPELSDSDDDGDDIIDDDEECPIRQALSGFNELGGIILHSAMLSGGKIAFHCNLFSFCDPFDNSVNASRVICPVFHIHGVKDKIVPISNGVTLYKKTKSKYPPWWVTNAHHNDIVSLHEKEYYRHLSSFIAHCLRRF